MSKLDQIIQIVSAVADEVRQVNRRLDQTNERLDENTNRLGSRIDVLQSLVLSRIDQLGELLIGVHRDLAKTNAEVDDVKRYVLKGFDDVSTKINGIGSLLSKMERHRNQLEAKFYREHGYDGKHEKGGA